MRTITQLSLLLIASLLLLASCQNSPTLPDVLPVVDGDYPAAPGFNADSSDARAIEIANAVMEAQGGYTNWRQARYLSWSFFGRRNLLWDKYTGDVRIDIPADSVTILVNIHDSTGRVRINGETVRDDSTRTAWLHKGKTIWINDSYWLVMPFKLKDSGVTLKYIGQTRPSSDTTLVADVLQLTFENVGATPLHKYRVYVDTATHLVCQWDYFDHYNRPTPNLSTPWKDYQRYGNLMLSGDRGENRLSQIEVLDKIDLKRLRAL